MPLRPWRLALLLASTVLLAGPAAGQPGAARRQAESLALGRELVGRNCSTCHAVGPADISLRAGAPAFRDLSERYPIETLGEALAEGLLVGHPEMPEFRFAPHEVAAILRYLESLQVRRQGGPAGLTPPAGPDLTETPTTRPGVGEAVNRRAP